MIESYVADSQFKIQRLFSKAFHAVGEDIYSTPWCQLVVDESMQVFGWD